jgi:hypothetical protein
VIDDGAPVRGPDADAQVLALTPGFDDSDVGKLVLEA